MTLLARTCSILMHCSGNINRGTKRNEGSEKRKFLSFPLCYFFFSILHMLVVYLYRIFISWFITNKICLFSVFLLLFSLQFAFLFSFFVPCTLFLSHYLCRATNRLHYVSFGTVSLLYRNLLSPPPPLSRSPPFAKGGSQRWGKCTQMPEFLKRISLPFKSFSLYIRSQLEVGIFQVKFTPSCAVTGHVMFSVGQ
jgi:hypothetical protein